MARRPPVSVGGHWLQFFKSTGSGRPNITGSSPLSCATALYRLFFSNNNTMKRREKKPQQATTITDNNNKITYIDSRHCYLISAREQVRLSFFICLYVLYIHTCIISASQSTATSFANLFTSLLVFIIPISHIASFNFIPFHSILNSFIVSQKNISFLRLPPTPHQQHIIMSSDNKLKVHVVYW